MDDRNRLLWEIPMTASISSMSTSWMCFMAVPRCFKSLPLRMDLLLMVVVCVLLLVLVLVHLKATLFAQWSSLLNASLPTTSKLCFSSCSCVYSPLPLLTMFGQRALRMDESDRSCFWIVFLLSRPLFPLNCQWNSAWLSIVAWWLYQSLVSILFGDHSLHDNNHNVFSYLLYRAFPHPICRKSGCLLLRQDWHIDRWRSRVWRCCNGRVSEKWANGIFEWWAYI